MVARKPRNTPDPADITAPEIAAKYGRTLSTVQRQWMVREEFPAPIGKRGRWNAYDAVAVDEAVRAHFIRTVAPVGDPDDLLTQIEIAEVTGLSASTIRADISRGRIGKPDDESDGVKRWKRSTITAAIAGRRRYGKS
ncbi:helix-turn-helix transcriptional regulator [Nocardia salmonicida]|uniref:helix-turn-helix transcriptional regulator n=1 Tax=Nocardia salmonicida TaxID=53431 RepID=UPI00379DB4CA